MKNLCTLLIILFGAISAFANKLVLLNNNLDSLRARVDYIQAAEKEIRVQYFSIDKDSLSFTTLALLRDAAERGVKVRILVDSMHNSMKPDTMSALTLALHPEIEPNIEIKVYNSFNILRPFRYTKRMHDKGLIVDKTAMVSGGRNIGNGYFGRYSKTSSGEALPIFEDSDVLVLESNAIHDASQYFDDLWNSKFVSSVNLYEYSKEQLSADYCRYQQDRDSFSCENQQKFHIKEVLDEEAKLKTFIQNYKSIQANEQYSPQNWLSLASTVENIEFLYDDVKNQNSNLAKPQKNTASRLYELIDEAQKNVIIISPYLVITPEQVLLFRRLKEKYIKVQIFTNSKLSNDSPAAYVGYEKTRQLALNEGVEVYEYQGPDTLHAKMVLIDNFKLFVGSFNWDYRSQNLNREVGIMATLSKLPLYEMNLDIFEKLERIMRNSCQLTIEACNPISNIKLADLSADEYELLQKLSSSRQNKKSKVWRFMFPLIKGQL